MSENKVKLSKKTIIIIAIVAVVVALVATALIIFEVGRINQGKLINRIIVNTYPEREYYVGESANFSDLKIEVLLNNGDTYFVDASECTITGFDSSVPVAEQRISVEYGGLFCAFYVVINEIPKPIPKLTAISLESMPKTEYVLGEWLDTTGGVIKLEYSDGSVKRVNLMNSNVYGFANVTQAGEYTLTVKYAERGVLCETTYKITVTENGNN